MIRTLIVTAGRGPVECRRAVGQVSQVLAAEAEALGFAVDAVPGPDADGEGPVSLRLLLSGEAEALAAFLHGWLGSVQWVARSERRSKADRKNWFVGIAEDAAAPADLPSVDVRDVVYTAMTAGGPGGQHQNKTASAVRALHKPSGIAVVVRSERSQHRNRALAVERIAALLALRARMDLVNNERRAWTLRVEVQRGDPVRVLTER
jgi:peptide chain release factor